MKNKETVEINEKGSQILGYKMPV